ncbi:MAG: hypothetical protein JOS17DRAFT_727591 [Linnemannia elongata]|nr:MAG: hypothetical protein JOS17DRAFT_727591 [Linnemannia elongata]
MQKTANNDFMPGDRRVPQLIPNYSYIGQSIVSFVFLLLPSIATILFPLFDSFSNSPSHSPSAFAQQIPIVCHSFNRTRLSHSKYKIVLPQQQPFSFLLGVCSRATVGITLERHTKPHKHTHIAKTSARCQLNSPPLRSLKSPDNSNMSLFRDLTSGGRSPPHIYLMTLSDPNSLASVGKSLKSTTSSKDPLSPLPSFPNNNNSYSSSNSSAKTFQQHQHYQHNQREHQPSSSSPPVPQQEDTVIDPGQAQGGKKRRMKKKKKTIASSDCSITPDKSSTPSTTLPTINEQDEILNKESLGWLKGTVAQSDTKPAGKKSKAKKKAAAAVATAQHFEQAGFKASQARFDEERKVVAQVPVNVGANVEPSHIVYDIHGRQVLYAVAAYGNDDFELLNDDFMNTATSNWADEIDEYEQKQASPISIVTTASPITSTTSLSTTAQQTAWEDLTPRTLVYKGPVVTQVAAAQSQDARFSSAPDTRRSHGHWESGPRARSGRDFSERHTDYHLPRPPREYPASPFDHHQPSYGEYTARPTDYHQRPLARYQPGMPHHPLLNEPPTLSHQRLMSDRPHFQHQTYYPGRPQGQQPHFERNMRPARLQSASQQQCCVRQEHRQQHQHPLASPGHDFGPTQAQVALKQSKAGDKADEADNNADNTWQSITSIKPENAWHLSTNPAWVTRLGTHEDQGPTESQYKPEVEMDKSATGCAALNASFQISGEPEDKRVAGLRMDTITSPQPPFHASQKNKHKKQEQRRRFSLSIQSQEETHSLMPSQMKSQARVEPLDQQLLADSDSEKLYHLQQLLFSDAPPPLEGVKDFELPWLASSKVRTGPEPWADRNKVIEFFSKRWVEARMSSGGCDPDATVVYCSSS